MTIFNTLETIEFAKRLPLDDFQISFMIPFPGTELYSIARQYGDFENDWEKMNLYSHPVFVPHGLTADDMRYYSKKAFREFYLRPRIVRGHVQRALSRPESVGRYISEGLRILKFLVRHEEKSPVLGLDIGSGPS